MPILFRDLPNAPNDSWHPLLGEGNVFGREMVVEVRVILTAERAWDGFIFLVD